MRDGAVVVSKDDGRSVDVPSGKAAIATTEKLELLDKIPDFMLFDKTPLPTKDLEKFVPDVFRDKDGTLLNMCTVR